MATINIKETYKKLRDNFNQYVNIPKEHEFIKLSEEDYRKLKTAKRLFDEYRINDVKIIKLSIEDNEYICTIGDIEARNLQYVHEVDFSFLLFISLIGLSSFSIKLNIDQDTAEQFLYPAVSGEGILDFEEIKKFFPQVKVFEIEDDNFFQAEQVRKTLINWIFEDRIYRRLDFSQDLIDSLLLILPHDFFDDFILEAYLAEKWIYCYLRLYRCLEPLFNNILAKNLKRTFRLSDNISSIIDSLKKENLVIPDEKDSITRLFELLDDILFNEFKIALKIDTNPNVKKTTIGKYVYKIRNKIVHHPASSSTKKDSTDPDIDFSKYTSKQWDEICTCMIKAIYHFHRILV